MEGSTHMPMEMTRRFVNGIALVDVRGPLAAGTMADGGSLRATVAQLAEAGYAEIAVHLDGVTSLDARGLGELVLALHAARERSVRLRFLAPSPRVQRMLSITRLDTVLDLCDSEAELSSTFGSFGSFGRSGRAQPLSSALFV
jgi:anti-anti-sigma factor